VPELFTSAINSRAERDRRPQAARRVSPAGLINRNSPIINQPEHHRMQTFQEEYREFLQRHHVEFDEQYMWD
jgi:NifB/MoaA-like Fe-S oxidoreductase